MATNEEIIEGLEEPQGETQGSQNTERIKGNDEGLPKVTYNQIEVNGEVKFKCGACDKMCDKEPYIKAHIKRVHMSKKTPAEQREREKNETDEGEGSKKTATQEVMNYVGTSDAADPSIEEVLKYSKPEVSAEVKNAEVEVIEEMDEDNVMYAEIEAMKKEINTMKGEMAALKQENETKTEMLEAKTGRCDALEEEKLVNNEKYISLSEVAKQMFNDLKEIQNAGGNAEAAQLKKSLKKANDELKNSEKNLNEYIKQCGEESNKRMAAEAELARSAGMVELMMRTVSMLSQGVATTPGTAGGMVGQEQGLVPGYQPWVAGGMGSATGRGGQEHGVGGQASGMATGPGVSSGLEGQGQRPANSAGAAAGLAKRSGAAQGMDGQSKGVSATEEVNVCRDWRSFEGCTQAVSCRWLHPPGKGRWAGRKECPFWLAGQCRYSEEHCNKGSHTDGKQGTKPWIPKNNVKQQQNQVFLPAQANIQNQVLAGAMTPEMKHIQMLQLQVQLLQGAQQGGLVVPRQ